MEKLSQNRPQLFLRNKYTVFIMGGTVALQSFWRATVLQQVNMLNFFLFWQLSPIDGGQWV